MITQLQHVNIESEGRSHTLSEHTTIFSNIMVSDVKNRVGMKSKMLLFKY